LAQLIQRAPFTATTSGDGSGSIRIRVGEGQMSTRGTARLQCQRCRVLVALGLNEDTIWRIYLRGIESQHNKRKPKDRGWLLSSCPNNHPTGFAFLQKHQHTLMEAVKGKQIVCCTRSAKAFLCRTGRLAGRTVCRKDGYKESSTHAV
jgi:hypothetical protein